jgi:hypothetical protein
MIETQNWNMKMRKEELIELDWQGLEKGGTKERQSADD